MQNFLLIPLILLFVACNSEPVEENVVQQSTTDTIPTNNIADADTSSALTSIDSTEFTYTDGAIELGWDILAMVDFEETFNEEVQAYIPYPTFHPPVKALEGKEVIVRGFIIPLEETGEETILVLSANPFSSCFFCGGAGPETVMDIKLKPNAKRNFKTDQQTAFRGKLKLNDSDLYYLNYILEDAESVK